jgi:nucleotide-binding universal stress UspA family protein
VRPAAATHYANVLVPLNGSSLAEAALGPARVLGARFGAEVHTLTGAVRRDEIWWHARYQDRLRAGSDADGLVMHLSTKRAVPEGIIAMAHDLAPCLVCMATHGRGRSAAVLGSTFSHVMASIDQPVLAVGPGSSPPRRHRHPIGWSPAWTAGPRPSRRCRPSPPGRGAWARP